MYCRECRSCEHTTAEHYMRESKHTGGRVAMSTTRKCGGCGQRGHTFARCHTNLYSSWAMRRIDVPALQAEVLLRERLHPIKRACIHEPNFLVVLMLSCYLQGALDGRSRAVSEAIAQGGKP
jgi:hypothetical protein